MSITIIIPCHNAAPWIAQAIESAAGQQDIDTPEIIVVENGSSDNSVEIAKQYLSVVKLVQTDAPLPNANVARNIGLRRATREWVQFLDADDYLELGKVASNLQVASVAEQCDAVYSPVIEETWSGGKAATRRIISYEDSEDDYTRWIRWKLCQTGGALWKRQALKKIGGWNKDMPHCQDNEICLRALKAGLNFAFDPTPSAVYRIHGEHTVSRRDPNAVSRTKSWLQLEMLNWLESTGQKTQAHRNAVGQALFENARMIAKTDIRDASRLLASTRKECPPVLAGSAAPLFYRVAYHLFGFANAERVARKLRS